jgi:hypothetical protein
MLDDQERQHTHEVRLFQGQAVQVGHAGSFGFTFDEDVGCGLCIYMRLYATILWKMVSPSQDLVCTYYIYNSSYGLQYRNMQL